MTRVSTSWGTIGIAAVKDPVEDKTTVMALPVMGVDEEKDKAEICEWGEPLSIDALKRIVRLAETNGTLIG